MMPEQVRRGDPAQAAPATFDRIQREADSRDKASPVFATQITDLDGHRGHPDAVISSS
jgi:hypothetical protein